MSSDSHEIVAPKASERRTSLVRPEDLTLSELEDRVRRLASSGLPEHKVALSLGFDSARALMRVPTLARAYAEEQTMRLAKVGRAILQSAEDGDVAAQKFILEKEGGWDQRDQPPSRIELAEEQAKLMENMPPEQVLAQLQAAAMAEYSLAPPGSEAAAAAWSRALSATAAREQLRGTPSTDPLQADFSAARANAEYARLRSSYAHLPDDELPPEVQEHLQWLKARTVPP